MRGETIWRGRLTPPGRGAHLSESPLPGRDESQKGSAWGVTVMPATVSHWGHGLPGLLCSGSQVISYCKGGLFMVSPSTAGLINKISQESGFTVGAGEACLCHSCVSPVPHLPPSPAAVSSFSSGAVF